MAEDAEVEDAFGVAVDVDEGVDLVVVKGGDLAGGEVEGDGGEGEVGGDVAGVEIDIAIGTLAIFPPGAVENGGPYKDGRGVSTHRLIQGGSGDVGAERGLFQDVQGVLTDSVMVKAGG